LFAVLFRIDFANELCLQEIVLHRKFRTVTSGIPSSIESPAKQKNGGTENGVKEKENLGSLLTRQALSTYESPNHMVLYKYAGYGGTCGDLPK